MYDSLQAVGRSLQWSYHDRDWECCQHKGIRCGPASGFGRVLAVSPLHEVLFQFFSEVYVQKAGSLALLVAVGHGGRP